MHMFGRARAIAGLLALLLALPAAAAWKSNEPLAFGGKPLLGSPENARLAWNPVAGRIGLAYIESGTGLITFVECRPGAGAVVKESVGATGVACLGLAYDAKGMPHIGALGTPNVMEYVRQADGAWAAGDTGVTTASNFRLGSFAVNPVTGDGAFLVNTLAGQPRPQAVFIYRQDGAWRTQVCGTGGIGGSSLAFTAEGVPYVVWCDDLPPTKEESVGMARRAGIATPGAARFQEITTGVAYMYMFQGRIAIDPADQTVRVGYMNTDWGIYERAWTGAGWSAPEIVDNKSQMNVGQLGFAISPAHDRAAIFPTADPISGGGSGGINMAYRDHATGAWKSEAMPFTGNVHGLDLLYAPDGRLYGLYNSLGDNQFHLLSGYSPPAPLYARVTMRNQTAPCAIHVFGLNANGAIVQDANIYETGMTVNEQITRYPENPARFLTGNEQSPWVELTQLNLSPTGNNKIKFYAIQEWGAYSNGLSPANFTLSLSSTPTDAGIFKTFTKAGAGSGIMVTIDLNRRDQVKDDLELSAWQNGIARALPKAAGRRPQRFPILTACAVPTSYFRAQTVANEMDTLTRLGVNGFLLGYVFNYDPPWDKAGFSYIGSGTNYRFPPYIIDNERANPDRAAIATYVKSDLKGFTDAGLRPKITFWTLYDEPSSNPMEYIAKSPVCQAKFREYLQKIGLTPQEFGATAWEQVLPTADKTQPKLYYHTAMYRSQQLVDLFKAGTDPLREMMPNVPTTANFSDEVETAGSIMASGVDQFALFEQGALQLGWTESWMPWTATLQLNGYLCDVLRAAVDGHGTGQFGIYNCRGWGLKLYWDIAAKAVSAVGHGAQQLFHYNWGPDYAMAIDTGSQRPTWYPGLQVSNYAIGGVEEYLVGAKVPRSRIAILYSQATDIWTLGESGPAFGQEMAGLWLLLRHLGYPVDIVQEKDVAAGKLAKDKYAVVFCTARHLLDTALPPLLAWVKAGGTLYLGPGALSRTQFDAPLGFDAQAGIGRQEFVYRDIPGVANNFPALKDLQPVTRGAGTLEALSGYQKLTATPRGTVLATFADGSPALLRTPLGNGTLLVSGFFPGLAYEKAAVLTRQQRDKDDPDFPSQSSGDWPAAYRELFAALLAPLKLPRPAATNHYLVEADRLEAPAAHPGTVIALTNWTGKPVKRLTITLPRNGMQGVPKTVIHKIVSQKTTGGVLTVTIDMDGPVDFLVVPRK